MFKQIIFFLLLLIGSYILLTSGSGCAQIGAPSGGIKDTIPPVLVKASPANKSTNVTAKTLTLTFDEYIDVQELSTNLFISPVQKSNPTVSFNRKTLSIKMKDTLLPNTTYSLNFGNAIRDINESNVLQGFTYLFSTGPTIDSLMLGGKVILAETGLTDSTLIAMLYREADDSAVQKRKPDYITKLQGDGTFLFENLPAANYKLYALKDGDGGKTYNSKSELFAFADTTLNVPGDSSLTVLYAYEEQKAPPARPPVLRPALEKRLRYTTNLKAQTQDLLQTLELSFNNSLKVFDTGKIILSDTSFSKIYPATVTMDSSRKKLTIQHTWAAGEAYAVALPKEVIKDTAGNTLPRNDTLKFTARKTTDYGNLVLRFKNADLSKNPVIQFIEGTAIKFSYPLISSEWSSKLFPPGEYEVRILFDENKNGKWDPGNYSEKRQPEKAITLPQKVSVRADWDNEREISF